MQETRSFQTSQSQGVGRTHPAPIEPLFVKRCWEPCNLTGSVHAWKVWAQWILRFKYLMYCSDIHLHHYFQESQKVPQLSNFFTVIYTEPRYTNVENNTGTARQMSSGHRTGEMNTQSSYSRLTRVYNTPFVSPLGERNTCFILFF